MSLALDASFQRALVIGISGAGKSTFARKLAALKKLPLVHLDQLYWNPGWQEAPPSVYRQRLDAVLAEPRWVIDGSNPSTLDLRLPRADAVFWLDRSRWACIVRVLKRVISTRGQVRPDMADGCPERLDLEFLRFVWTYPEKFNPRITAALERHNAMSRTLILHSDHEAQACLDALTPG
jgi:adenylate kinase family enzyme